MGDSDRDRLGSGRSRSFVPAALPDNSAPGCVRQESKVSKGRSLPQETPVLPLDLHSQYWTEGKFHRLT